MAKKYNVNIFTKRGSKKVYKKLRIIKKQIKINKKKYLAKNKQIKKSGYVKIPSSFGKQRRTNRFGGMQPGVFSHDSKYGYNQDVKQTPGIGYSSQYVQNSKINMGRPSRQKYGDEYGNAHVPNSNIPVYGVGKPFFTDIIPSALPPNWFGSRQPDGSFYLYGSPFSAYKKSSSFGKTRK